MSDKTVVVDDYTFDELLTEANDNLANLENELSDSAENLKDALDDASKNLKENLEKLAKKAKKEVKSDVLNFYHDNKQLINSDLKTLNTHVKGILTDVKDDISGAIEDTDNKEDKKALRELRKDVARFSSKYNHKYSALKIKLAIGNAGIDIKNFF